MAAEQGQKNSHVTKVGRGGQTEEGGSSLFIVGSPPVSSLFWLSMALNCMEWECCKCTNYMCICRYVLILNGWKFKSMWFFPSILLSIITSLVSSKPTVFSCSLMSDSLKPRGLLPARLLCPWNFPDKNTGVGCYFLLQGSSRLWIEPVSLESLALTSGFFTTAPPGKSQQLWPILLNSVW